MPFLSRRCEQRRFFFKRRYFCCIAFLAHYKFSDVLSRILLDKTFDASMVGLPVLSSDVFFGGWGGGGRGGLEGVPVLGVTSPFGLFPATLFTSGQILELGTNPRLVIFCGICFCWYMCLHH